MRRQALGVGLMLAVFVAGAVVWEWAHPFSDGPLRGSVAATAGSDEECMPNVGATHFTLGGTNLRNASEQWIEIKSLSLVRPVGVRIGRSYLMGIENQTLAGSSSRDFPPPTVPAYKWTAKQPAAPGSIGPKSETELLVELIPLRNPSAISVDSVKIEYSDGRHRPWSTYTTVRHLVKPRCA